MKPGTFKKGAARILDKQDPIVRPVKTMVWSIPVQPRDPKTDTARPSPLGKAILLLAFLAGMAHAGTTITAPQHAAPTRLFPDTAATGAGINVTDPPYNADPSGASDSTLAIQTAIDTGKSPINLSGKFLVCSSNTVPVLLRSSNQTIRGSATIVCGPACASGCFVGSPPPPLGVGAIQAAHDVTLQDLNFTGGASGLSFINVEGDDLQHLKLKNVGCDVGQPLNATGLGAVCVQMQGMSQVDIDDLNCFSTVVGKGQCINSQRGAHDVHIRRARMLGMSKGIIIVANPDLSNSTQTEEVTDGVEISGGWGDGMWYTAPILNGCVGGTAPCTSSGGTVTYGGTTIVDSAAPFKNLCSGTLSSTCAATTTCSAGCPGDVLRVMVPKATVADAASSFFSGGRIKSPSIDYTGLGVQKGDLIRTGLLCNGNGNLPVTTVQNTCVGGAGVGGWGDSCACTANADCSSAVCEARFAIVVEPVTIQVAGGPACTAANKCELMIEEWLSDSTRRPVSAPPTGAGFTVFDPLISEVHDFTTTTVNLCVGNCTGSINGWRDLLGNNTTPSAGAIYEILTPRPGYTFINADASVRNTKLFENTSLRSFSDGMSTFGYRWQIYGNTIEDGSDVCLTVNGSHHLIWGNLFNHCGSQGTFLAVRDSEVFDNNSINNVWTNPNSGTVPQGDFTISAANRLNFHNNHAERILALAGGAKYGIAVSGAGGASAGVILDGNTITGSYATSAYRFDNAALTALHLRNWNGEAITVNSTPTYFIEGGNAVFANLPTTQVQNGSYAGCSDCTVASPCAAVGAGSFAKRQAGAWNCP